MGKGLTVEVSEGLCKFEWFMHDPLLLVVPSDFFVPSQREVFAQRVSLKSVVGQEAAQVRVSTEEYAVQIVRFALVPVCALVDLRNRGDGCRFRCVRLDSDTGVVSDGEQVVDYLEPVVPGRVIYATDIHDGFELCGGVILKECHDWDDGTRGNVYRQFILPNPIASARQKSYVR